jgi:hypothetical protein
MVQVIGANRFENQSAPQLRNLHPMKGPMVTRSLRGLGEGPFQWRGDRATIEALVARVGSLLGGPALPIGDVLALRNFLTSLRHHPNPHRRIDGTFPDEVAGGNPALGRQRFLERRNGCMICHALPAGSDNNIDNPQFAPVTDFVKNPPLRTLYQKAFFDSSPGARSLSGFGFNRDGASGRLPIPHAIPPHELTGDDLADVAAFLLCFDSGTAPAVGYCRTVDAQNRSDPGVRDDLLMLEAQAVANAIDLVVRGRRTGRSTSFYYDAPAQEYVPDSAAAPPVSRTGLLAGLQAGDAMTFLGVIPLSGPLWGGDRDDDFVRDADEPPPALSIAVIVTDSVVEWPRDPGGWVLEESPNLSSTHWRAVTRPLESIAGGFRLRDPGTVPGRFYRLKRTW